MMLIGQNLSEVSEQFIILFFPNMNERNLFKQKTKTFEFVHNRMYVCGPWPQNPHNPTRRDKRIGEFRNSR